MLDFNTELSQDRLKSPIQLMPFWIKHSLVLTASAQAVQFALMLECPEGDTWTILNPFPLCIFRTSISLDCIQQFSQPEEEWKAVVKPIFFSVENMESEQMTILPLVSNLPTTFVCGCMQSSIGDFLSKNDSNSTVSQFLYVWTMDNSHFNKILTVMFVKLWSVL